MKNKKIKKPKKNKLSKREKRLIEEYNKGKVLRPDEDIDNKEYIKSKENEHGYTKKSN